MSTLTSTQQWREFWPTVFQYAVDNALYDTIHGMLVDLATDCQRNWAYAYYCQNDQSPPHRRMLRSCSQ